VVTPKLVSYSYLHEAVVAWIDKTTAPSLLPVVAVTASAVVAAPSG
jgi:hypothetical protein